MAQQEVRQAPRGLIAKISVLQTRMGSLRKNGHGYQYTYTTLSELLNSLRPAFQDLHLAWTAQDNFETTDHGVYTVQKVTVFDVETKQSLCSEHVWPAQTDAQKDGSYETYYRRYSLISLLGLASEDDDGKATRTATRNRWRGVRPVHPVQRQAQAQKPGPITAEQERTIMAALKMMGATSPQTARKIINGYLKSPVEHLKELSSVQAANLITTMRGTNGKQQ